MLRAGFADIRAIRDRASEALALFNIAMRLDSEGRTDEAVTLLDRAEADRGAQADFKPIAALAQAGEILCCR